MSRNISAQLYRLGVKIRNPSYFDAYQDLCASDFMTVDQLNSIQQRRLNDLIRFAFENSAYYHSKLSHIFHKDKVLDVHDLKHIPITTKTELIEHNDSIHTIRKHKFKKLFFSETSGTDGRALTFYKDERWDSYNRASIARGLSWYGVKPSDRNGYLWGYSLKPSKKFKCAVLDTIQNRFRLFSYDASSTISFLRELKNAEYLHGYSSMIYELAKIANDHGLQANLRLVKGTSEKIYEHYHPQALSAFGSKVVSEYGAAETGIIAFECPHGGLHINEETCIVEVLDGQIVVTNLFSFSFPIIRYKLGDYVTLANVPCKCGRHRSLISDVQGRVGKNIIGENGERFPSLTLYYIFKRLALEHNIPLNYRAEQHARGTMLLFIEETLTKEQELLLLSVCKDYLQEAVLVSLIQGQLIHEKKGKLKDFYSTLEVE